MEDGAWHDTDEGTPQGGIVSPLLANIYLNELDRYIMSLWGGLPSTVRENPKRSASLTPCFIVRYADDFVVLVRGTHEQAERLKVQIAEFLDQELHLELSAEKTAVTAVEDGIDFLGFTIRRRPRGTLITPSQKAMRRFRDKVKQIAWEGFGLDDQAAVTLLNRYLTGWGMYYRRVSSSQAFSEADYYVWHRVFRTSYRLRNPRLEPQAHYKAHYIPYRFDIYAPNWRHGGRNYGTWADKAHTRAYIVTSLKFFPIRYVRLYPQLNPYVPAERAELEKRVEVLAPPPDLLIGPGYNPDYGADWPTVRSEVLKAAGHRRNRCGRHITGRIAHVHHRVKCKGFKGCVSVLGRVVSLGPDVVKAAAQNRRAHWQ